jgi:hypothetical protein
VKNIEKKHAILLTRTTHDWRNGHTLFFMGDRRGGKMKNKKIIT